jgi:hypothetical protein
LLRDHEVWVVCGLNEGLGDLHPSKTRSLSWHCGSGSASATATREQRRKKKQPEANAPSKLTKLHRHVRVGMMRKVRIPYPTVVFAPLNCEFHKRLETRVDLKLTLTAL